MKTIVNQQHGTFRTKDVIATVVGESPQQGIRVDEMRRRIRILDAVAKSEDHILLEDEDHKLLKTIMEQFPFSVARKELLAVIDGILEAPDWVAPVPAKANGATANHAAT